MHLICIDASRSKSESTSVNNSSSFLENGNILKPPRFNHLNFSLWKSGMILFMEGIDSRYLTILRDGPIIPKDHFSKDGSTNTQMKKKLCYQQIHFKSESKYIEEDWKLSELSLLSLSLSPLSLSLPYEVYHSLVNFPTTKEMWSTLSVLYERSAEVKKSKKITLIRKYEFFSHERGESLTNYYNRFNSLLNDLLLMGNLYDNEEVLNKFMDGLPDF
ncbi:LOW QUALITY PROTEIN: hypothetical protein OSB04_016993 [Centaurea solstitialis]|uniref:Uncharacterized protein n=1 Tax=Centaurea solstitialis TaxID=347529 RepID=A0AA38T9P7_9ASTR|nr:LOW QUALITY PROTEIN: hypothetical protein OSB04_016993 [Centaurea solstitialis]